MNSREKTNVYGRKFPIFGTQFGIFPKEKKETKERLARRVLKVFKDQRVTKATRETLDQWDLKDPAAPLDLVRQCLLCHLYLPLVLAVP